MGKCEFESLICAKFNVFSLLPRCSDPNDVVRPVVRLEDCITSFASQVEIDDFFSSAINKKTIGHM